MGQRIPMWRRYLRFYGADPEAEVTDELGFHLEQKIEELKAAGLSPEEARQRSLKEFGDVERVKLVCQGIVEAKERSRQRRDYLTGWRQDVRYAWRQLRRNFGSTLLAVLILALGMGATTAIFSIVYAVVLKPLPFPRPEQMVSVWSTREGIDEEVTPRNFDEWKKGNGSFSQLAAAEPESFTLTDGGEPVQVPGALVSADFFRVFGTGAEEGRTFTLEEDRPGGAHVVVISDGLWKERFGGDAGLVGREIHLNTVPYTVIGIMPRVLDLTKTSTQIWTPLALTGQELSWTGGVFEVTGRLKQGRTLGEAQSEMNVLARRLEMQYPEMNRGRGIRVRSFASTVTGEYRQRLLLLLGAVGFVLAIACSNVANLLLARGAARHKEFAIRAAIGADRKRIARQLLTESLLLAVMSAAAGVGLAQGAMKVLVAAGRADVPRIGEAAMDPVTLLFALGVTFASSLFFGVWPAWQAARQDVQSGLREGGRTSETSVKSRLRDVFISGQVALSLMLLLAAGSFIAAALRAERVKPGFAVAHVMTARTALPTARYSDAAQVANTYRRMREEIEQQPGVTSVALTSKVPLTPGDMGVMIKRDAVATPLREDVAVELRFVSADYLRTMGIPLEQGREFSVRDRANTPHVAMVSETAAQRLWPGGSAVGEVIRVPELEGDSAWRITGVASDAHENGLLTSYPAVLYIPIEQLSKNAWHWAGQSLYIVVRTKMKASEVARRVDETVHRMDPNLPLGDRVTMEQRVAGSMAAARLYSFLLMLLGVSGLVLTTGGIYGVVAYFVNRQTGEIGVRMALGASGARVRWWVLQQGMKPVLLGIGGGLLCSVLLLRVAASQLFGGSGDWWTVGPVILVVGVTAVAACSIPARRASKVDPMAAMRGE